jgi:hypothetical protein
MEGSGVKKIAHRIYSDFMLPDRFEEYDRLLSLALERGYEVLSIENMWRLLKGPGIARGRKYLILRHDIDTDPGGAEPFRRIEARRKVTASYYFRLSTLDIPLMRKIAAQGGEASYHFEELATYCKAKGLRNLAEVRRHLPAMERLFSGNLRRLRQKSGLPMTIVASHGDWMNRELGVTNAFITENATLRKELDIELEVYDDVFMRHVTSRHSDQGYPKFWKPDAVAPALEAESPVVYMLTHTRHWRANVLANLSENWSRLKEELRFRAAS